MNQEVRDLLISTRVKMQKSLPFFSYLSMYLKFEEDSKVPTLCVNSEGVLKYNPKFIKTLSRSEVTGVLCHEVLHVAFEHLSRLGVRQPTLANIAMDLVVNELLNQNSIDLPKGGLIPNTNHSYSFGKVVVKDIDKKIWEEIYDELKTQITKTQISTVDKERFDTHSFSKSKDSRDQNSKSKNSNQRKEDIWKKRLTEAFTYANIQGKTPLGVDRLIENLHSPKLPWRHLLMKYITQYIPSDYTYIRPSKKSLAIGIYMPSVTKEDLDIVIGVDTSGSITQELLRDFVSELLGILKDFPQVKMTLLMCDAGIHSVETINNKFDINQLKIKGGGGTDFRPVFDWVNQHQPETRLIVYLTDLYGDFPSHWDGPVIWCCPKSSSSVEVPFGSKVVIE
ncbi:MAG: hypothetical protein DRZ76_01815 [Candidatus Nealsonbacteria bacterium]|nr:MAG: hypothetical protein DRZ76_01815 [Candidatus Nealsonbacteria bacterium]